jgi:antitoxin component of MazEF toxin-antitoxin module
MAHLVKIGNSQGIRIPKPLIQQARLEGKELDIKLVNQGILVTPSKNQEKVGKRLSKLFLLAKVWKHQTMSGWMPH